jgi:hypothetical protein
MGKMGIGIGIGTGTEIEIGSDDPHLRRGTIVIEATEGERTPGNEGDKKTFPSQGGNKLTTYVFTDKTCSPDASSEVEVNAI